MKLRKSLFTRNRDREVEFGDFFSKTSKGLMYILPLIITVFFTPAMVVTSFFSKEIIIMLANITLCLGYITNFCWRIYHGEISSSVLLVSVLALAAFIIAGYFLFPPLAALTFINVFTFVNQMAIGVNLFFLIKDAIIPPCKKLIENIAHGMGCNIEGRYYSKPPLTLEEDRYIIDQLLMKSYGHDSFSPKFEQEQLDRLNNLLTKLSQYIDKYDESILGYINNKDSITDLEKQIAQLTTLGNAEPAYTYIKRKIGFKKTKINLLKEAANTVTETLDNPETDPRHAMRFFSGVNIQKVNKHREKILKGGLTCLEKEIKRQQKKIDLLDECLPKPRL